MAISWSRFNRDSNREAEAIYRKALDIEPENGRALAFLATSIAMKISNGWSNNITADSFAAWSMGKKAISLLPDDPIVLVSYGHLNTCLGKASDAVQILERSNELTLFATTKVAPIFVTGSRNCGNKVAPLRGCR